MSLFKKIQIPVIALLMLAIACKPKTDDSIEIVSVGGEEVCVIHADKISRSEEVKISDWVKDLRIIQLEANKESSFDYIMRVYVGKDYILISTINQGILMFDQNGKFIRTLAAHGRGPGEVTDANRNIFVDEKNDRLYATDMMMLTDRLISYGIHTRDFKILENMHKGLEIGIRDVIVRDDSLMYMTPMQVRGGKSDCPLFCQTTSGRLLWETKMINPLGITDASIEMVGGQIFMYYNFVTDTIWRLNGSKLTPVIVLASEAKRAFLKEEIGSIYLGMSPVTDQIFIGYYAAIKSLDMDKRYGRVRPTYSTREHFIFNLKTRQVANIGSVKNDFLGLDKDFYPRFQPNGVMTASFQALDLREMADSVSRLPGTSPEVKKRLENILQTVTDNDNPILLVGKLKI